mmetsp:Transcript_11911/g.42607  ORF Transcript_11911/g.42607 Transcript_11911/m.42607 type:complete len:240 (-) Transcript_11911:102-821(-)
MASAFDMSETWQHEDASPKVSLHDWLTLRPVEIKKKLAERTASFDSFTAERVTDTGHCILEDPPCNFDFGGLEDWKQMDIAASALNSMPDFTADDWFADVPDMPGFNSTEYGGELRASPGVSCYSRPCCVWDASSDTSATTVAGSSSRHRDTGSFCIDEWTDDLHNNNDKAYVDGCRGGPRARLNVFEPVSTASLFEDDMFNFGSEMDTPACDQPTWEEDPADTSAAIFCSEGRDSWRR